MSAPSTRTQVLIVWTLICAVVVVALALVAQGSQPDCFECGLPAALAEIGMLLVLGVWAVVAAIVWYWFAPRRSARNIQSFR